jgi:hypothetical protein
VNGKVRGDILFGDFNQKGFLAVRATDNVGNVSRGGRSVQYETRQVNRFYDRSATSMDGFTADAPWAVETLADGTNVFSDSPGGTYKESANVSLTSNPITVPSSDVSILLELSYDVEKTFDFLNVEASSDGVSWRRVERFTGNSGGFVRKIIGLQSLNLANSVQLRFRLESDPTINNEGVYVKNIAMVAPAP